MKAPLSWLARYVELDRDAIELARVLTAAGTEVDRVEHIGAEWSSLRVAEIVGIDKHPNADRLQLATVNLGTESLRVVCGAPNIAVGQKVPFAPVGAVIQGHALEARPIRGIVSEGMLCAADELGLSPDHSGILVLDSSEVAGRPLEAVLGDDVLEFAIKPGRGDCLGMIGLAREISALTGKPLRMPTIALAEGGAPIAERFQLRIDCPDLCPRFVACLITDVTIDQSPWWLQRLLHGAGVRAINNVVDVTNFIMLEWAKPIHAYDYDYLRGRQIVVRRAADGERMTTLDGVEREMSADTVVIADGEGAIGLGGIMGGAESEVKDHTRNVLLESANFDAASMRRTAKRLGMHSEAVRRFERGIDPNVTDVAADHAAYWFATLAGGTVAPGRLDVDHLDHARRSITFDPDETGRLLGKRYSGEHCARVLTSLGFEVRPLPSPLPEGEGTGRGGEVTAVTVPSWRLDVKESADLVEEVARITGYDDLPVTMPSGEIPLAPAQPVEWTRRMELEDSLRLVLRGAGLTEVVTYSLVSEKAHSDLVLGGSPVAATERSLLTALSIEPLRLANAMTEEQQYLRTSLLPTMLAACAVNQRHTDHGLWLFELGRAYWPRPDDLPDEKKVLALLLTGSRAPAGWWGSEPAADFAAMRGAIDLVLEEARVQAQFQPAAHPSLHPGRAAELRAGGDLIGYFGELHPLLRERLDLGPESVLVAEVDLEVLVRHASPAPRYSGIHRYPPVGRQLSVAVGAGVSADQVREVILRSGGSLLVDVALADVFELPDGRRSLSYSYVLQSDERTLTNEEANEVADGIVAALSQQLGAVQR